MKRHTPVPAPNVQGKSENLNPIAINMTYWQLEVHMTSHICMGHNIHNNHQ